MENISSPIILSEDYITALTILDTQMFCNTAQAFALNKQKNIVNEYSLWKDNNQLTDNDYYVISDCFNLPVYDKIFTKRLSVGLEKDINNDIDFKTNLCEIIESLNSLLMNSMITKETSFVSNKDIDLLKILNLLKFKPDIDLYNSLLENLINYINLLNDTDLIKPIIFINLKNFLTKNQLGSFYNFIISKKLIVFLVDNTNHYEPLKYEYNICIDQDFIETRLTNF